MLTGTKMVCRNHQFASEPQLMCLLGFLYVLYASENTFGDLEQYAIAE